MFVCLVWSSGKKKVDLCDQYRGIELQVACSSNPFFLGLGKNNVAVFIIAWHPWESPTQPSHLITLLEGAMWCIGVSPKAKGGVGRDVHLPQQLALSQHWCLSKACRTIFCCLPGKRLLIKMVTYISETRWISGEILFFCFSLRQSSHQVTNILLIKWESVA